VDVRSYPLYAALTVVKTVVRHLVPSHRWNRRALHQRLDWCSRGGLEIARIDNGLLASSPGSRAACVLASALLEELQAPHGSVSRPVGPIA